MRIRTSYGLVLVLMAVVTASLFSGCAPHDSGQSEEPAAEARVRSGGDDIGRPMPATLFLQAALDGKTDTIRTALQSGTGVDMTDEEGRTALMMSAFNGHAATVELLLDAGAGVNIRDKSGRTALMYASTGPFGKTVEQLLQHGAQVDAIDSEEGWTALMHAAAEGQRDVVILLLDHGADAAIKDIDGDTAGSFALQNGHDDLARKLGAVPPVE